MLKNILILFTFFITTNLASQKNKHVLYGEKAIYYQPLENEFGLFFDKNGDIYSNDIIKKTDLIAHKSSLKEFYKQNPARFLAISKKYNLEFITYSDENFSVFQDSIAVKNIRKINKFQENSSLFILIHGFRKSFVKRTRSTTSIEDYAYLKKGILNVQKDTTKTKFLEIYWDGMFDSFFGEEKSPLKEILKLYEKEAQQNAKKTGYALRKIVSKIDTKQYHIITHSLGAQVGICLLTNAYANTIDKHITKLKTPSQNKINVFMIAPAMSSEPFKEYYNRETNLNFEENDNYFLSVIYNKKDIVLRKKIFIFGPGPKKYGNTTLGCNHKNEIGVLEDLFTNNYKNSFLKTYSTTENKDHRIKNYIKTKNFKNYILEISN